MHFAHNPSWAGGGMFLLSSESHVGCQILSLLMKHGARVRLLLTGGKGHPARAEFGVIGAHCWHLSSACIRQGAGGETVYMPKACT